MTNIPVLERRPWVVATAGCPKHMTYGPCAGVRPGGECEVSTVGPCSFMDLGLFAETVAPWPDLATPSTPPASAGRPADLVNATAFAATAALRPVVVADLPAPALDHDGLRRCADALAGAADACLLGDHGDARAQFPPSYRAAQVIAQGLPAWAGLNCRDRNRVALQAEIAACLATGVTGIHCVTGDHPALGDQPDAKPVFDLDSVQVTQLAAGRGVLVSVAHAPVAPPVQLRLARLQVKIAAGADVVFVDHCGGPEQVAETVSALRATGFLGLVLACVPLVTSVATAQVVQSFAHGRLPAGYLEDVMSASDPAAAGMTAGTDLAQQMLAIAGVNGVNISGGATAGEELHAASQMAEISRRVLGMPVAA